MLNAVTNDVQVSSSLQSTGGDSVFSTLNLPEKVSETNQTSTRVDNINSNENSVLWENRLSRDEIALTTRPLGSLIGKLFSSEVQRTLHLISDQEVKPYIKSLVPIDPEMGPNVNNIIEGFANKVSEDFIRLRSHFLNLTEDPKGNFSDLLAVPIQNEPEMLLTPLSIVVKLEAYDYGNLSDTLFFAALGQQSVGVTINYTTIPEALRGKLVLVDYGDGLFNTRRPDEELFRTTRHEELHSLFNTFFRLAEPPWSSTVDTALDSVDPNSPLESHKKIATNLALSLSEVARSEVLSYCSTGEFKLKATDLFSTSFQSIRRVLSNYIDKEIPDPDMRKEVRSIYRTEISETFENIRRYTLAATQLYNNLNTQSSTPKEQLDALICLIPVKKVDLLESFVLTDPGLRRAA